MVTKLGDVVVKFLAQSGLKSERDRFRMDVALSDDYVKSALIRTLWIGAAVLVMVSATTYLVARLAADLSIVWILEEVHENLSVGKDIALPTWFAVSLWALLGLLAWTHGKLDNRWRSSWMILALVAWTASVDEFLMLHERLSKPASLIQDALGFDLGPARWILVGGVVAMAVATVLVRLILSLPSIALRDVVLGAGAFLMGAIGFELAGILAVNLTGSYGWLYMLTMHVEEGLEFIGVVLAIRGLLCILPLRSGPTAESQATGHAHAGRTLAPETTM